MVALAGGLICGAARLVGAQDRLELVVAATTDVHGRIRGWDYFRNEADPARSLAAAATIVDSLRRANPNRVVLVDAGDLLQGNPLTYVAAKAAPTPVHPVIAAMNVMRYDAAVIGNHEFNYGVPFLQRALSNAAFPFLAANVTYATGQPFVAPMTMVSRAGARVAIIGATTPGSMVWDRDNLRAVGLTVGDIVPAVRKQVAAARAAGADVIVALLHSGLDSPSTYDTSAVGLGGENVAARVAREIPGIDVVVFGHSHRELVDTTINGTLLIQPRNWATTVGIATLTLQKSGRKWEVIGRKGSRVVVAGHREAPDVLAASTRTHRAAVAWSTSTIGESAFAWRSDSARVVDAPIVDFVAETMRRETGADLATASAFSLDASLGTGPITVADVARLYPYENTLRVVRIAGSQLKAFLEHSARYYRSLDADGRVPAQGIVDQSVAGYDFDVVTGAEYTIDLRRPLGSRIVGLAIKGRAVQPADTFTLAVNNYRQSGGGGYAMIAEAPVVYSRDVELRTLLIEEVRRRGTIAPADYATQNWRLEPATAVAAAYREQHAGRGAEAAGGSPALSNARPLALKRGPTKRVRVISSSDFHGALRTRTQGGAAPLSAAIARAERECTGDCVSVVVDAGDLFTGSPESDWDAGRPTVAVFNQLGIAAGALGNHEFDFTQDTLRMRLRELQYNVLGANVRGTDGKLPSYLRADTVVTRGDVRIGIVGAASEHTPETTKRRNVRDLTFLPPAPIITERVRALRRDGAQVVIALIHDGARCTDGESGGCTGSGLDVARTVADAAPADRPDVFVMGHAHTNVNLRAGSMPIVQVSSNGRAIAVVDVPLDGAAGARNSNAVIRTTRGDSVAEAKPAVDSIVRAASAKVQTRMERPVATMASELKRDGDQYPLGNLITDAMRIIGNADFAADNNGGIRANVPAGAIQFGGVHEVVPFGNTLVRVRLRGKDLAKAIERYLRGRGPDAHVSGMIVEYDPAKPPSQRVVRITTATGTAIQAEKIYSLVINDFMLDDAGFGPANTVSVEMLNIVDADAFAEYLRRQPQPVRAPTEVRIRPRAGGAPR